MYPAAFVRVLLKGRRRERAVSIGFPPSFGEINLRLKVYYFRGRKMWIDSRRFVMTRRDLKPKNKIQSSKQRRKRDPHPFRILKFSLYFLSTLNVTWRYFLSVRRLPLLVRRINISFKKEETIFINKEVTSKILKSRLFDILRTFFYTCKDKKRIWEPST